MKRRQFLKSLAACGTTPYIPAGLTMASFSQLAKAAPIDYAAAGFTNPAGNIMPQVINIFLYGGPSELAGNLTNIVDIEGNSQNSYRAQFNDNDFLNPTSDPDNPGQVTTNGFWNDAGGVEMEAMLAAGDMSIYRTMLKQKSPTRSHRESIFMSHKGSIDIEGTPGTGTRLAAFLLQNKAAVDGLNLADGTAMSSFAGGLNGAILPFVSFEGESNSFALDPENPIPLRMRGNTLNEDFDNPYSRNRIFGNDTQGNNANTAFDALVNKVALEAYNTRFRQAADGFSLRADMQNVINDLSNAADEGANPLPVGTNYPNNNFADRVKAAVTLALHNPSSFYITVGGGLGGWDDHNNGVDRYPDRMRNVMQTVQAAMAHINGFTLNTVNGATRTTTGNIVINVYGDFGRLVNLNGSNGWDHANNQNLYTFGGIDLRPQGLGKVVGETLRVGTANTNNQFTMPSGLDRSGDGTANTYHFEPMAVAATTYSYFGAQDTKPLTDSPEMGEPGDDPIDQTNAIPNLRI